MAETPRRTILWHAPGQTALLRRLSRRAELAVVGVGCPDSTQASALARQWGGETQPLDDLRAAIATAQRGTLVLIADPGSFGSPVTAASQRTSTRLDVEELDAAEERGVKVVSMEPIPAALTQLSEGGVKAGVAAGGVDAPGGGATLASRDWAMVAPLSRFSRPVQELVELMPTLGPPRAVSVHALGAPAHGSLGARLFDAADLLLMLMGPGPAESVNAVFSAPGAPGARGIHAAAPTSDHVRGLDGDLSGSLRFDGGRAATFTASNRAGSHALTVTVLSDAATATIRGGRLAVHHHADDAVPVAPSTRPDEDPFIDDLAVQITRYADSGVGLAGRVNFAATLALAQAALLSARTGEPESPATMLRLAGL